MNNSSNFSCDGFGEVHSNEHFLYILAFSLIFIVGLLANTCVIVLIMIVHELRKACNVFILVLCVSNNVFLINFVPVEIFQPEFHNNSLFLKSFDQFILIMSSSVSILSLVMMSFDRWSAVVRPMEIKRHSGKTTALKVTAVLILGTALALPAGFVNELYEYEECNVTFIVLDTEHRLKVVTWYCFVFLYICPLCLISFLYFSMARKLMTQGKTIRESLRHNVKPRAQRSRVAWVVIGLIVSFAVCWFPYYLFLITIVTDPEYYNRQMYEVLLRWRPIVSYLNTVIDPLSIFLLGSRFRNHLMHILCIIFGNNKRWRREGPLSATLRRAQSSSSTKSTTRTTLNLPPVHPQDSGC